jgi:hypothetical protein
MDFEQSFVLSFCDAAVPTYLCFWQNFFFSKYNTGPSGTDFMILKLFSAKNETTYSQTTVSLCKK